MIGPARENDPAEMEGLYLSCFDDPKDFAGAVFEGIFRPEASAVYRLDGEIVSMVLFPSLPLSDGRRAGYIYAACTRPDMRGRGYMSELLGYALGRIRERGDSLALLIPAKEELFGYYKGLGFETAFYRVEYPQSLCGMKRAEKGDLEAIAAVAQKHPLGVDVCRSGEDIAFLDRLYSTLGGGFYTDGERFALFDGQNVIFASEGKKTDLPRGMAVYFEDPGEGLCPGVLFD